MPSQVFNRHYWSARELVVLGVFSAAAKLSTLLVALVGGGMNPVSLLAKNLIFTTLLVVMLYKVRKPGTLALFVLVNMLIPAMLLAAGCAEAAMACSGGMRKPWAPVLGVAVYDLTSKVFSLGVSWLFMRESPALLYVIVPIVVIGYVGSLCGLFSGVRAVRELRHAGIVRN